jgi:hypothetical protein
MERRRVARSRSNGDGNPSSRASSRRRFLAALGAGGTVATAGCLAGVRSRLPFVGTNEEADAAPERSREPSVAETYRDVDLPVPESELARGADRDTIPAITDPVFAPDWSGIDPALVDESLVIGVERDGVARAYPLKLLNWHEVVNDDLGGPLVVTYCPLCASGVVADRTVDGETLAFGGSGSTATGASKEVVTSFGVSGLLWRADLVMYDETTGSLWSQLLATAIRGELTGTDLALYPSAVTTWGQWRESHPDAEVILPRRRRTPSGGGWSSPTTGTRTSDTRAPAGSASVGPGTSTSGSTPRPRSSASHAMGSPGPTRCPSSRRRVR